MKKIVVLLVAMMFIMSAIHMSATADALGTYLEGETLQTENLSIIGEDLTQKSVEENETMAKQLCMTIGSKIAKLYGKDLAMDVAPQIVNGRTMLPARYVTENIGGEIEWIGEHQIVAITRDASVLVFQIGSDSAILLTFLDDSEENYVFNIDMTDELNSIVGGYEGNDDIYNGNIGFDYIDYKASIGEYDEETEYTVSEIKLDSAPALISGRTFMPVRVIATFLGADVMWDGETQTIMIEPKN